MDARAEELRRQQCLQRVQQEWDTLKRQGSHNNTVCHGHHFIDLRLPSKEQKWGIKQGLLHRSGCKLRSCLHPKLDFTETCSPQVSSRRTHHSNTDLCHDNRILCNVCDARELWAGITACITKHEYEPLQPDIRRVHAIPLGILALRHPHANPKLHIIRSFHDLDPKRYRNTFASIVHHHLPSLRHYDRVSDLSASEIKSETFLASQAWRAAAESID